MLILESVKMDTRKPINPTSRMASAIATDRPESVRNSCVIEVVCDVFNDDLCALRFRDSLSYNWAR